MRDTILFDVEIFSGDFYLYIDIPNHEPLVMMNPGVDYVKLFMMRAKIDKRCILYGQFWDLHRYLYSKKWLRLSATNT